MIGVSFNGRLGNNMFQIATGVSIATKLREDFICPLTTYAGHRGVIPVDLSMFAYEFKRGDVDNKNSYHENGFNFNEINVDVNTTIHGFFQSWKYFDNIKDELINKYFSPSDKIIERLSKYSISSNSLGISIRRGDYLMLQDNHCVLSSDYYQTCINKYFMNNNIDEIYIFSDDVDWCKNIFGNAVNYVIDDVGTQLFLMTRMKHLILSNSTFAWWGAYLNQNDGMIIAPTPWFGKNYSHYNTDDLYHPSWTKQHHDIQIQQFSITRNMYE